MTSERTTFPSEQQRRAYLDALGVDVWVPRNASEADEVNANATICGVVVFKGEALR